MNIEIKVKITKYHWLAYCAEQGAPRNMYPYLVSFFEKHYENQTQEDVNLPDEICGYEPDEDTVSQN